MSTHGGRRAGAGRKPKAEKYATAIEVAEGRIRDRLPTIIDRLFELADGVTVQEPAGGEAARVYTRPPNLRALIYLIDRVMGKPTERQEMTARLPELPEAMEAALAKVYGDDEYFARVMAGGKAPAPPEDQPS